MSAATEKKTMREWAADAYDTMLPIEKALTHALYEADYSHEPTDTVARTIHVSPAVAEQISTTTTALPDVAASVTIGAGRRFAGIAEWQAAQTPVWKNQPTFNTPVKFFEIRVEAHKGMRDDRGYITTWIGPQPWEKPEQRVKIYVRA